MDTPPILSLLSARLSARHFTYVYLMKILQKLSVESDIAFISQVGGAKPEEAALQEALCCEWLLSW